MEELAMMGIFFRKESHRKIQITLVMYPQFATQKNTTYVQQNKMVPCENKVKRKIEFELITKSSKKVKESSEKLNTADSAILYNGTIDTNTVLYILRTLNTGQ